MSGGRKVMSFFEANRLKDAAVVLAPQLLPKQNQNL